MFVHGSSHLSVFVCARMCVHLCMCVRVHDNTRPCVVPVVCVFVVCVCFRGNSKTYYTKLRHSIKNRFGITPIAVIAVIVMITISTMITVVDMLVIVHVYCLDFCCFSNFRGFLVLLFLLFVWRSGIMVAIVCSFCFFFVCSMICMVLSFCVVCLMRLFCLMFLALFSAICCVAFLFFVRIV